MPEILRAHRGVVLLVLTAVVAGVLALVFANWFSRTWGWRRTIRSLGRQFALGLRDLALVSTAGHRFRRDVRAVAALLADPALARDTVTALAAAADEAAASEPAARAAGVRPLHAAVSADSIRVTLLGRGAGIPRPVFNRARIRAAGSARVPVDPAVVGTSAAVDPAGQGQGHCPVVVGLVAGAGAALALLDLAALPAVGTIEGPPARARRLAAAIAAQLAAGLTTAGGVRLSVTAGLLPGYRGPSLSEALDLLDGPPDSDWSPEQATGTGTVPAGGLTVLVCAGIDDDELPRLGRLVQQHPELRILTVGRLGMTRWRLEIDPIGHVTVPELGVHADAAPLERGLDRALRRRVRTRRRPGGNDAAPPNAGTVPTGTTSASSPPLGSHTPGSPTPTMPTPTMPTPTMPTPSAPPLSAPPLGVAAAGERVRVGQADQDDDGDARRRVGTAAGATGGEAAELAAPEPVRGVGRQAAAAGERPAVEVAAGAAAAGQ
ncbi:hypothetical protein [Frankia sp. AgB32]|uniref:hypothetical protein n=1 Tax=Frankia sp. AgB32 TaxID=631119 RepID=UPI00200DFCE0|nr:hypothetical protein [Frankia sp. AgB32]MCK9894405.1 hypothetical protein [Frankia sp. AgB32]